MCIEHINQYTRCGHTTRYKDKCGHYRALRKYPGHIIQKVHVYDEPCDTCEEAFMREERRRAWREEQARQQAEERRQAGIARYQAQQMAIIERERQEALAEERDRALELEEARAGKKASRH